MRGDAGELSIADLRLPIDGSGGAAARNRKSQIVNRRFTRYIVSRGWLHLVLLTGVAIFAFPFVWMVATSIKTDEGVVAPHWMPAMPRFVGKSPYVLPTRELNKPMDVDAADWARLLP